MHRTLAILLRALAENNANLKPIPSAKNDARPLFIGHSTQRYRDNKIADNGVQLCAN